MKSFFTKLSSLLVVNFLTLASFAHADIKNPIEANNIQKLVASLLDILLDIGAVVVVVMIIISGLKFVMAKGNPEELGKAKGMLWYTLIGGAVVLSAIAIQELITNTVEELR